MMGGMNEVRMGSENEDGHPQGVGLMITGIERRSKLITPL